MKILWIEDFGDKLTRSELVEELFSDLFKEISLANEFDGDNRDTAGQLARLFAEHTLHEIYVCKSYVEWTDVDAQHRGDFDIALIDINLGSYTTPNHKRPPGMESPEFDKKAGFCIYHQLIKRGFPDNNIAFFTAQGLSLKEFSQYCGDIFLERPANCFEKYRPHFERIRQWLAEKEDQQSLILRRGIIDGSRFMREKIGALEPSDLNARLFFYKTIPGVADDNAEALRRDSIDYLTRLERRFLSHQNDDEADLYKIFINELSAKWEESKWSYVRRKVTPRFGSWQEEQFHRTAHFQMKMLRNWSSHRLLSREVGAKEIAYFFVLAMRLLVQRDLNDIARFERILARLFDGVSDLELNRLTNSALGFYLERSYEQLKVLHKDVLRLVRERLDGKDPRNNLNRRIDNYFLGIFRELGEVLNWLEQVEQVEPDVLAFHRRRIREVSIRLFYQSFWHGLFPLQIKSTYYADLQTIRFYIEPLQDSFLTFIGQTTFDECFGEKEASVDVA